MANREVMINILGKVTEQGGSYACVDNRYTAMLRSLRLLGWAEKAPGRTPSDKVTWRLTRLGMEKYKELALSPERACGSKEIANGN